MKIISKKPWWWFLIGEKWGNVIFAFGDSIYSKEKLTADQIVHEEVHLKQMKYSKIYGIWHIIRLQFSDKFYLKCELEAYKAQNKIKHDPERYASYLSSSIYGNIITYNEALKELCE